MRIISVPAFKDNYIWLLVDDNSQQVICVDPGEANPVIQWIECQQLKLQSILITHHHADHTGGIEDLINTYSQVKVYGPDDTRIFNLTHVLHEQEELSLPPYHFKIIETPGHTQTHICFYEITQGWLFCGDTLFSAGCGRLFEGTYEELYNSLQKLSHLPPATQVFCGHEYTRKNLQFAATVEPSNLDQQRYAEKLNDPNLYCSLPSTIELENKVNPFLRTMEESVQEYARQNGVKMITPLSVFKLLRKEKDNFS